MIFTTYDFLAASVHVGWSAYLALFLSLVLSSRLALWILVPALLVKEFVFDLLVEQDTVADGAIDTVLCLAGFALGLVSRWFYFYSRGRGAQVDGL